MTLHRSTLLAATALLLAPPLAPLALSAAPDETPAQGLPLRHVALFSSGVGYFERAGTVRGNGDIELYFQRDDLNDVLKSLVVTDPSGELQPATYALDELLAQRPQNNTLPLPPGETLGGILRAFQGASVEIEAGKLRARGRLLSVAAKTLRDENGIVTTVDVATILQENGLTSVRLDTVENGGTVRLLDEKLNRQLLAQLETQATRLTSSADAGYRPLRLHFAGKGERAVKAGYIQATSVWKTSYRLVFDAPKKEESATAKPLLQGWAIVENTTDEDWKNVGLSLIAGRPVSFRMNLAAPLYVQRPEVALPFAGAPRSQVYEEATQTNTLKPMPAPKSDAGPQGPPGLANRARGIFSNAGDFAGGVAREDAVASAEQLMQQQASAATAERGELFEYAIRQPVSLNRGEAALVPIVSENVTGEKLSILDTRQSPLRAVHGMRIKNTTGLHLAGGPITIYQDGVYAGDAQITSIAPGDNRLISYALDLDLVVGRESPSLAATMTGLAIKAGVLTITRKQRRTQAFSLRNKAPYAKTVLLQLPQETDYKLVEPAEPSEKSPTEYRFEVPVPAQETKEFKVVSERVLSETVAILDANVDRLLLDARHAEVSPAVKAALEGVVTRRNQIKALQERRATVEKQIKEISDEQSRIRSNMGYLARESDLYKQYVAKLTKQETEIEALREELARLRDEESKASEELSTYVQSLNVAG